MTSSSSRLRSNNVLTPDSGHHSGVDPDFMTNVTPRQNGVGTNVMGEALDPSPSFYAFSREIANHAMTPVSTNGSSGSPLRRAGLLQPKSYVSSSSSSHHPHSYVPHSQTDIRTSTMQLSNMYLSPSQPQPPGQPLPSPGRDDFIFPIVQSGRITPSGGLQQPQNEDEHGVYHSDLSGPPHVVLSTSRRSSVFSAAEDLTASATSASTDTSVSTADTVTTEHTRAATPTRNVVPYPSGISILLARQHSEENSPEGPTPTAEYPRSGLPTMYDGLLSPASPAPPSRHDERTPLLSSPLPQFPIYIPARPPTPCKLKNKPSLSLLATKISHGLKYATSKDSVESFVKTSVKSLPAVLLGTLLNILDGVSYGMIIFPAAGIFADLGGMGVSLFFVSAVIAQLIYTLGGSGFAGANGSMMIEVVPFFHIIASTIAREIGEDKPQEVIATTLVAFAMSSVLTGLSFFLLGALRLGALIGFFPRHILVGCIGGVGAFLIETGLTVSTRISDDDFSYTLSTLKFMCEPHNLVLWLPALGLAVLLRVITHKFHHQLIFPLYFIVIPMVFYIVVAAAQLDLGVLRQTGWLFDMGNSGKRSWYEFYTYYDIRKIQFSAIWATLPTQFALLFFNILHPPLNVPALAVSLNEDVDTNKELVAHGYSNLLAGVLGTVPNYLVYVNTLLFYRVGGGTRIAGFLLAVATAALLFIGTGPISYIPVMVVGALIFVLGIDLVKEALWDTRHRVNRSEYLTIASIVVVMTVWDFVLGVLFGIVVSCFFFVVQNSQRRSIRSLHTGEMAVSAVRRPSAHRAYIREVSKQTMILRLQGFLFFGTITRVEETIRNIVEDSSWQRTPIRFLVVDLSLVAGVDMSSAEAFVRVQRMLAARNVVLVFCGFTTDSAVGMALQSVGVLGENSVELFVTFSDAMEWTENAYLRAWFRSQKAEVSAVVLPGRQDTEINFPHSLASSPRRSQLHDAGYRTIGNDISSYLAAGESAEPYNTLIKAFSSYGDINREKLRPLVPYLERRSVPEGMILWKQNEDPDGLYFIESGVLRASYKFADHTPSVDESMVPGTLAGELSALAGLPRNATVVVERQAVLWKLSIPNLRRLEKDNPALATTFMQLVLKAAKIDYDVLLSALATRQ